MHLENPKEWFFFFFYKTEIRKLPIYEMIQYFEFGKGSCPSSSNPEDLSFYNATFWIEILNLYWS